MGHEWRGFARDPSQCIKTRMWFFTWRSTSKGGTGNGLPIAFLDESRKSTSSISPSRLRSDSLSGTEASGTHKNKMTARKGTWAISPNSCTSHPLHSHTFWYYSRSKHDNFWDWLQEACHLVRVRWEARCKGFRSEEGPHYHFLAKCQEPAGMHTGAKSAWEGIWQLSFDKQQSTLFTRLEITLRFQSRAVLHWLSGGLCHARKCQFENKTKKGMIRVCPTDVRTRNLRRERRNGERKPVLILVPGTHEHLTSRKHVMCERKFEGACMV